jgi:hypothetical protein
VLYRKRSELKIIDRLFASLLLDDTFGMDHGTDGGQLLFEAIFWGNSWECIGKT